MYYWQNKLGYVLSVLQYLKNFETIEPGADNVQILLISPIDHYLDVTVTPDLKTRNYL